MAPSTDISDTTIFFSKHYAIRKPHKRLQLVFRAIYFVVALSKKALAKNLIFHPFSSNASYIAIEIPSIDHVMHEQERFADFDKKALADLVKEKSILRLHQYGGVKQIAAILGTSPQAGLSSDDVDWRIEVFGSNAYIRPPAKHFLMFVADGFKDSTIIILLICAALSLAFGIKQHGPKQGWYDGGSIIIAVILVISVSAISNFKQSLQFKNLSEKNGDIKVEVVRDGKRQPISIYNVIVGDIVCIKTGDQVPADGLLLDGYSLKVDESTMTGESEQVDVNETENPFLLSGTKVTDGFGYMLITSVGMNTTWGQVMSSITYDTKVQTPLQERLNKLTSYIGKLGLLVAALVLVVMLARYFTGNTKNEIGQKEFHGSKTNSDDIMNSIIRIVSTAVTIIVVAIPEGLPLAVTLTLAYSMKQMMADNAMVRNLSGCETMGSTDTICTDKTGTLTLNEMQVVEFCLGKEAIRKGSTSEIYPGVLRLLQEGSGLNSTGDIYISPSSDAPEITGSPTERAILSWALSDINMDILELRQRHEILHIEAFNSEKKRSGVLVREKDTNKIYIHWKGAAEMILALCSNYCTKSGKIVDMTSEERMQIESIIKDMASKSLRCIAFACKKFAEESQGVDNKLEETDFTFMGLVGLKDPCRPGVKEAVESCRSAGVDIKMITGDNVFTAKSIAIECSILNPNEDMNQAVVEGITFRNYSQEERMEKVDKIHVLARSSPVDKLLMVQCLQQKGQVVAVTGDGTNDAPALKEADIGLSMGIQGTEVAKESSDIVIMDDNFKSVVTILKWGRGVYNNIQKFIQFQLTVNVAALVINFIAAVSSGEVPLTTVQLLWVNLIMDTLGALALATEKPTNELLKKKSVGRTEPLITNVMWRNLIVQASYQVSVLLILQFRGSSIFRVNKRVKDTIIFNTFVFCQVFNEFNARKMENKNIFKGVLSNRVFLSIVGITIVLQVVLVEFLRKFAGTERLDIVQWVACIVIASMSWPIDWAAKSIPLPVKWFPPPDQV